jgi:hypothetical protein
MLGLIGPAGAAITGSHALIGLRIAAAQVQKPTPVGPPIAGRYAEAVLASHPVAYWRLGERKGSQRAADSSGNNHSGAYRGEPHLGQPGAIADDENTAVGLDGPASKSFVEIPNSKMFSIASSGEGLTIEVWVRPDVLDFPGENPDPGNAYIYWLGKGAAGKQEWALRFYNHSAIRSNRISAYVWSPKGGQGAGAYFENKLTAKQWMYVVATYDDPKARNARVQIYKNGVPSEHNSSRGALYKSYDIHAQHGDAPLRLGTDSLLGFLTGGLDEVAIYPRALKPEEIASHWARAHI